MPNNPINKVVFDGRTLIDLTDTTATADKIKTGYGAYGADGVWMDGTATTGGDNGDVYQDEEGYIVLKPGAGTNVSVTPLSVTENGTYSAPTGVAYSPVTVDVEQGDMLPHFYVHYASDYETITSTTCDMTYSEILTLMGGFEECSALVYKGFPDEENPGEETYSVTPEGATCRYDSTNNNIIIYAIDSFGGPIYTITYTSGGALSTVANSPKYAYDLIVNGATVTAPSGYYPYDASKSVASAAQATPTIAFSSNGLITATAVQTSGYVSAGTKTSTYGLTTRSAADMTVNGSYVTAPSGYYSQAFSKAVSLGTLSFKDIVVDSNKFTFNPTINSSTGVISYRGSWRTYYSDITSLSSGYISSVPSGSYTVDISGSKQLPTLSAQTFTPASTVQYIPSYNWLTGSQTILGDANLVPSNIASGVSIFGVTGTHAGGGDSLEDALVTKAASLTTYENSRITEIGAGAFAFNSTISIFSFPNVVSIGNSAFLGAKGAGINIIDLSRCNFSACTYIGSSAFAYYPFLASTKIESTTFPLVVSAGKGAFMDAGIVGAYFPSLSIIPAYFLAGNYLSTSYTIQFPNAIEIGSFAFAEQHIAVNAEGAYIGENNFQNVELISSYAFYGRSYSSTGLASWLAGVSLSKVSLIRDYAFAYQTKMKYAYFSLVKSIGNSAFLSCDRLSDVYIPEVSYIGSYAFQSCYSLNSISCSNAISIGTCGFAYCRSLISAYFPNVTELGIGAFSSCATLQDINAENVVTINTNAFYSCAALSSIYLPKVSSFIGMGAFYNCSSLEVVDFGSASNITSLSSSCFYSCKSLKSIYLPKVSWIGSSAFYHCSNMSFALFGTSYSSGSISASAFYSCKSLFSLYLLNEFYTLQNNGVFYSTPISISIASTYGSIYVPASLYDTYISATNWVNFSSRFVSMTDAEIEALLSTLT